MTAREDRGVQVEARTDDPYLGAMDPARCAACLAHPSLPCAQHAAPLPEWATEEQSRCVHCGGHIAACEAGWIDDDGDLVGSLGHRHTPVALTDGGAEP